MLEHEVVDLVLLSSVRGRRIESIDFDGSVVACSRKVLVCGVECDTLDVTLVIRQRLQLLKGVS